MTMLPVLIGISIIFFGFAVWFFFWNVNSGQYDDLESPAHSILYDDDEQLIPRDHHNSQQTSSADDNKPDA